LATLAVNCSVAPSGRPAELGSTEIVIPVTVTLAEANLVGSASDLAESVTVKFPAGMGAEYVAGTPVAVIAGETLPHGVAEHQTVHMTP
jgi:hypothetical protein